MNLHDPKEHPIPLLTVTELTRRIKSLLERGIPTIVLQGEISNFKRHTSGHMYFTLKDEHAQIAAVLWRSRTAFLRFPLEDGMSVIVTGKLSVYEPRGSYQIEIYSIRPLGIGELQQAFERLKRLLHAEGLFDPAHKKSLPAYPERIALVTSPDGAAFHDILHILNRRFPALEVILRPVRVQGPGAAKDIADAIREINRLGNVDVMIVGRGGGSLEDLWAYNEEVVARAIYASNVPVISAVGHEIDFTIADLVADLRAPTPSAAAELVVKAREAVLESMYQYWYHMRELVHTRLAEQKEEIRYLLNSYGFHKPVDTLRHSGQRIDELEKDLVTAIHRRLTLSRFSADSLRQRLLALNPEMTLKRGYTIVSRDGVIVTSSLIPAENDVLDIRFHDGVVRSTVRESGQ
jgi:exodeoxyribonuclease VII large subunit